MDVIDACTPDYVTTVLRRAGALADGRVSAVTVESSHDTVTARVARLRLEYAGDDHGPASLFVKRARAGVSEEIAAPSAREVEFYERIAPAMPEAVAPRCFEAVCEPPPGRRHLLLEDLTDSHVGVGEWPMAPPLDQCERIIDTYARFHGFWWDHARLGVSVGVFRTEEDFDQRAADFAKRYAAFVDRLGDRLSAERREIYDRMMRAAPRLRARYQARRHLTLMHGDAHVWNLMMPRDPARHSIRLIDWDGWRIGVATGDLAYMMAVHWYPERRARFERRLLERYHAGVVSQGVTGYDLEALRVDYRLAVVSLLAVPVWQASSKIGPWVWWSHLERIMMAIDDLGCRELLDY